MILSILINIRLDDDTLRKIASLIKDEYIKVWFTKELDKDKFNIKDKLKSTYKINVLSNIYIVIEKVILIKDKEKKNKDIIKSIRIVTKKLLEVFFEQLREYINYNTLLWTSKDIKIDVPIAYLINLCYYDWFEVLPNEHYVKFFIDILVESLYLLNLIEKKITIYKTVSISKSKERSQENWVIKLNKDDIHYALYKLTNQILEKFLFLDKVPPKWVFISNKEICLDDTNYLKESLITNNYYVFLNDIVSFTTKKHVELINTIQEMPYSVDKELFNNFFTLFKLKDYILESRSKLNFKLKLNFKSKNKHISDKEMYSKYVIYWKDKTRYQVNIFNEVMKEIDIIEYKQGYNTIKGSQKSTHINDHLVIVFMFLVNGKTLIYMVKKIDKRSRIYDDGPISITGSRLLRDFITLPKDSYSIINKRSKYFYYYFARQLHGRKVTRFNKIKNYYDDYFKGIDKDNSTRLAEKVLRDSSLKLKVKCKLIKLLKGNNNATVSIDATSSLLQIMGMITKNKRLLKYTNVYNSKESVDLYTKIISKLEVIYKDDLFYHYYVHRKIVKYSCMTYLYGSTSLYIAKDIIKHFNVYIHIRDLTTIVNNIIDCFKKFMPVVVAVKKYVNFYISHLHTNDNIILDLGDKTLNYTESQTDKKSLIINVKKHNDEKKKMYELYLEHIKKSKKKAKEIKITDKINLSIYLKNWKKKDKSKKKKSCLVNIIHAKDAEICLKTRTQLWEKYKIYSQSVHDCFIVNIGNYKKCLRTYNNCLVELYKDNFTKILKLEKLFIFFFNYLSSLLRNNSYDIIALILIRAYELASKIHKIIEDEGAINNKLSYYKKKINMFNIKIKECSNMIKREKKQRIKLKIIRKKIKLKISREKINMFNIKIKECSNMIKIGKKQIIKLKISREKIKIINSILEKEDKTTTYIDIVTILYNVIIFKRKLTSIEVNHKKKLSTIKALNNYLPFYKDDIRNVVKNLKLLIEKHTKEKSTKGFIKLVQCLFYKDLIEYKKLHLELKYYETLRKKDLNKIKESDFSLSPE